MNQTKTDTQRISHCRTPRLFFNAVINSISIVLFASLLLPAPLASTEKSNPSLRIGFQEGMIVFEVHNTPMEDILKKLNDEFKVVIAGMEERANEKVTYSARAASLSELLKGFLQHLAVNNYALEYNSERLNRVSIFPEAKGTTEVSGNPKSHQAAQDESTTKVSATEVQTVVDGSQAKESGIMEGDLIVQYDGVKIHRAAELVKESKKKTPDETVEMIVKRDGQTVRLTLKGGYIGIRIKTIKVSPADIEVR